MASAEPTKAFLLIRILFCGIADLALTASSSAAAGELLYRDVCEHGAETSS